MDGSVGHFHYEATSNSSSTSKWMLYFEGGGWCYDEDDCVERSKTTLGSSKLSNPDIGISTSVPDGILSRDCDVNPGK